MPPANPIRRRPRLRAALALSLLCALLGACDRAPRAAEIERGRLLLWQYGCGGCHRIDGVVGATGEVGPPLNDLHRRVYLAGVLANSRANLAQWIQSPRQIDPPTAMPDLGVSADQARDMAAYLYRRQ